LRARVSVAANGMYFITYGVDEDPTSCTTSPYIGLSRGQL